MFCICKISRLQNTQITNAMIFDYILPFASNCELRTFYHVCLRFKRKRLPLKRANLNLSIKQFLLRNKHVCKPRLQCFKNVTQCFVSVCRCFVLDCWYLNDLLLKCRCKSKFYHRLLLYQMSIFAKYLLQVFDMLTRADERFPPCS